MNTALWSFFGAVVGAMGVVTASTIQSWWMARSARKTREGTDKREDKSQERNAGDWWEEQAVTMRAELAKLTADFATMQSENANLKLAVAHQQIRIVELESELYRLTHPYISSPANSAMTTTTTTTTAPTTIAPTEPTPPPA